MIVKGNTYGDVRVPSAGQSTDRQLIAVGERGILPGRMYVDKQSDKGFNHPACKRPMRRQHPGDLLVASIDRLGRDCRDIQEQWRMVCREKGVNIQVLDMPLLGAFISALVLQLLCFVTENERQHIRKRQAESIAAAKARGVHMGRRPAPAPGGFPEMAARRQAGETTFSELVAHTGMARTALYHKLINSGYVRGADTVSSR